MNRQYHFAENNLPISQCQSVSAVNNGPHWIFKRYTIPRFTFYGPTEPRRYVIGNKWEMTADSKIHDMVNSGCQMKDKPKTYYEQEVERITENLSLRKYHYEQVLQSKTFMEKYYSEKIDLEEISAAAFMSRFHYIRIFQQVYGVTPRQYLRDLRISKAKELLKKGLSVTRICFDVGYESLPTFSSAFKRGTGYSPKEYQKLNNSNPE